MSAPTVTVTTMTEPERDRLATSGPDAGLGALRTERGNLPLELVGVRAQVTGLAGAVRLTQGFTNPYDQPLEATYIFPLPDRFAVTGLTMTAADRTVQAELRERAAARVEYEQAIAEGKRAAIAEEERPDVFTMRVGNILPGERVSVELSLAGPLSYEDGEATFRFPLVVAPRYIPGKPLDGTPVGDGYAPDTDAVPDASRITPPVLLPGFPNPVQLSIEVTVDTGGLPLDRARSSLPTQQGEDGTIKVVPGQRVDRDFVLRLQYGEPVHASHGLIMASDVEGPEGTFQLTVLPPTGAAIPRPRDVVLVLDRSGSMGGWKMVAARRAAARIIDTLTGVDRFAVLTFDNVVERPPDLPDGLVPATDRHRFRAVEHLARADARGGTEMLRPLREALDLLTKAPAGADGERDRVLVLVTDGQVGNEDQILRETASAVAQAEQQATAIERVRVHTVGIDQAVNAGFLGRMAAYGGGRCELVESEDRLDEAMDHIHRRIGTPLITGLTVAGGDGFELVAGTVSPARRPDLFPGAPVVFTGRFRGAAVGAVVVRGQDLDGKSWQARVEGSAVEGDAVTRTWARAYLRDLEDRYVTLGAGAELTELERRIVETSLRFGVLCRFTAFVAVDSRVVTDGSGPHRVVQPVEPAAGWDMLRPPAVAAPGGMMTMAAMTGPAGLESAAGGKARSFGMRRSAAARTGFSPRAAAEQPRPAVTADDARELAALELRRLWAASTASAYERRQLLDDLATRLSALVGDLARPAVAELLADIRSGSGDLDELWARALRVLEKLAGPAAAAGPTAAAKPAAQPPRTPFWKR